MDQDKTDIPHITSNPKAMAGGYTLDTHVTGAIAHGRCTMMAIDCGDFPHDSNLTIEVIIRLLHQFKVCSILNTACTDVTELYPQDTLPPVLYIQMDNTCRDNKNKYTLTFTALLVQLGIFKKVCICHFVVIKTFPCMNTYLIQHKVKLGFLPVGHTHEDIDQRFSCISRQLSRRNALSIPGTLRC